MTFRRRLQHVRLTLEASRALITYVGAPGGIWIESKQGPLIKDVPHPLKEGDIVVFRTTDEPGFGKAEDTLRGNVEFIYGGGKTVRPRASIHALPPMAASQSQVIGSTGTSPRPRARSIGNEVEAAHTDLKHELRIPWSEGSTRGYGLDAVTGVYTAATVFENDYNFVEKWNRKTNTKVSHLQWQTVIETQDDFDIGIGATVNVLSHAVGANANITQMLSKTMSASTILVQSKHEVRLTLDSFPPDIPVRKEAQQQDEVAFAARYGHYYVAGYDKVYSCCMTVTCRNTKGNVNEAHAQEAIAVVEKYLKGGIKFSDLHREESTWSLDSVVVDTEGYSDHLRLSNQILDVKAAPQKLSELLNDNTQDGFPRVVILRHYSTLPSLHHLTRRIAIPALSFDRARVMRELFVYLQDYCRPHPALKYFEDELKAITDVIERFTRMQESLVRLGHLPGTAIDALKHDLIASKKQASMIIERHDYLRSIKDMDTKIFPALPEQADHLYFHQWHCGMTKGAKGQSATPTMAGGPVTTSSLKPALDKSFDQRHRVYQLQWKTSETSGRAILHRPPQNITFSTRVESRPPPPRMSSSRLRFWRRQGTALMQPVVESEAAGSTAMEQRPQLPATPNGISFSPSPSTGFDHCINHAPVYIIGWTLACYWPKQTVPRVQSVDHESSILADRLALSVDKSYRTQWHCAVFFVKQSDYNFPDLLAEESPTSLIKRPNWFKRRFTKDQ
ncbi:FHA domain-containing protein [Favolaschia claudopus]|uniref:FHA domain-containing protein n=1 Tax=Favolaschia claudopus TaxID=2862362 RepID=A0AAW0DND1_9AGAR